jgi:hypothetical protein
MTATLPTQSRRRVPDPQDGDDPGGEPERVRPRALRLASISPYLLGWAAVLFAVEVLVFLACWTALQHLGVLDSVSRAAATVLGDSPPADGALPVLQLPTLLPWVLLVAAGLAVLWLVAALAVVVVHNGLCALLAPARARTR